MKNIFVFIFLLLASLCLGEQDPLALYLTWQRSPETTMIVNWITDINTHKDTIYFKKAGDFSWFEGEGAHHSMPDNHPYLIHAVELTNLLPGKEYEFKIGKDGVIHKCKTISNDPHESIHFVVGGDMYHDDIAFLHETNREAAKTSPQFAIIGGDIAYAADKISTNLPDCFNYFFDSKHGQNVQRWIDWLVAWKNDMVTPEGRMIPLLPVIGNHDTSGRFGQTPTEAAFFYALFPMPGMQGYEVLDIGNNLSIFLLDSGHTHPVKGEQSEWLAKALKERENVQHKFAVYHVPAYPSARSYSNSKCSTIRAVWTPIFEKYGLSAAFEHHDHAYKRTYLIKNGKRDPQGVLYLGDGAWGIHHPRKTKSKDKTWYLAKAESLRHFIHVTLSENHRLFRAISSKGELIDEFQQ